MLQEQSNPTVLLRVPLHLAEKLQEISEEQTDFQTASTADSLLRLLEAVTVHAALGDTDLNLFEVAAMSAMFAHYRFLKEFASLNLDILEDGKEVGQP